MSSKTVDKFTEQNRCFLPNAMAIKAKELFEDDYQFKKSYLLSEAEILTGQIID